MVNSIIIHLYQIYLLIVCKNKSIVTTSQIFGRRRTASVSHFHNFEGITAYSSWINLVQRIDDKTHKFSQVNFWSINALASFVILEHDIIDEVGDVQIYMVSNTYFLNNDVKYQTTKVSSTSEDTITQERLPVMDVSFNLEPCEAEFLNKNSSFNTSFE